MRIHLRQLTTRANFTTLRDGWHRTGRKKITRTGESTLCHGAFLLQECEESVTAVSGGLGAVSQMVMLGAGTPVAGHRDHGLWHFCGTRRSRTRRHRHTTSATGVIDRAVLAILENNVQPDGSVVVPKALRPHLGGIERIESPPGA
jgi:hypothetical protein